MRPRPSPEMARPAFDPQAAGAELLERTRAEQGLEPTVTDPVAIDKIATVVLTAEQNAAREASASRAASRPGSAA
jgi:hypothetical protein